MQRNNKCARAGGRRRRGSVAVELAVMAPLMFTMLFGIIEFGWLFSVRNALINAAREGARLGAIAGTTSADIHDRVMEYLTPMGLASKVSVAITEPTDEDPVVMVDITVPQADVSLLGDFFGFETGMVEGVASMRREGT